MKQFKIIKSVDYALYPTYREVLTISKALEKTISSSKNILISGIFGIVLEKALISSLLIEFAKNQFDSNAIQDILNYDGLPVLLSIFLSIIVYFFLSLGNTLVEFISSFFENNKNTRYKRDIIVEEFYKCLIPQLIEIKGIFEKTLICKGKDELTKECLLLLQAQHELLDLYVRTSEMRIVEHGKGGKQTNHSQILCGRISNCAYITFLTEMLEISDKILMRLKEKYQSVARDEIQAIETTINSSTVYDVVDDKIFIEYLKEIRRKYFSNIKGEVK